jgi:hypothetical protein
VPRETWGAVFKAREMRDPQRGIDADRKDRTVRVTGDHVLGQRHCPQRIVPPQLPSPDNCYAYIFATDAGMNPLDDGIDGCLRILQWRIPLIKPITPTRYRTQCDEASPHLCEVLVATY